ncbi:carbon catabolite repressor protein 4 homolog 3 isoform X2 [Euphorbia lathyris]|uniref:carbon catabolite repressor protein 4 homolog 3 isoform X2 n=1 Tax=Euphorbia lathyris TaxID=212925 RepID=UPI003313AB24
MVVTNTSSCWLRPTAPFFSRRSHKRRPSCFFFVSFSCKSTTNFIHYCSITSTHDSSSTSSVPLFSSDSYIPRRKNPIRRRPYARYFPEIRRHWVEADQPHASQERFTVVSYNILANRNAFKHRDLYSNVDPLHLKWEHRKRMICKELIGLKPDVICMQEVDKYFDLLKIMENAGYAASYKRRTGDTVDGCAIFWKANKFGLLERESIEYKALGLRDNVAQLLVFEILGAESRRVLICNIHVLYNPSRGEVKLGQIRFLLSRAQILVEKWGDIPVILAGDFNSTPQSAIYKFLDSSELNIMLYDRKELSGQRNCHPPQVFGVDKEMKNPLALMDGVLKNCWTSEEVKVATGKAECPLLKHPLGLNSSYATVKGSTRTRNLNGEPLATSYHSKFLGIQRVLYLHEFWILYRLIFLEEQAAFHVRNWEVITWLWFLSLPLHNNQRKITERAYFFCY